jgi:glucose-1-phosphate thymidylyltransferase
MSADPKSIASGDPIALIPAAGFATRLGPLPCSKEILPLGWSPENPQGCGRPLIGYLLERLALGGVRDGIIITRPQKGDIAETLGDGHEWDLDLHYVLTEATSSTIETLDRAYDRVRGRSIVLGYPDMVFRPADAYASVIATQRETGAEVVLGLFPTTQPEASDMVELDANGTISALVIKQPDRGLLYMWSIAAWSARFTDYLHDHLRLGANPSSEPYVGDVIQSAIRDGLDVRAECFPHGASIDLGTPEALADPPPWIE